MKKSIISGVLVMVSLITLSQCHEKGHDHHAHDDEHSSVKLTILKDVNTFGLSLETHKDALLNSETNEPPSILQVNNDLEKLVMFENKNCSYNNKDARSVEQGHHEIYHLSATVVCPSSPEKIIFGFSEIYSTIKNIHINFSDDNNNIQKTVQSTEAFSLP